jgi:hypothetical protein
MEAEDAKSLAEAEKIVQRCAADNADHPAFLLSLVGVRTAQPPPAGGVTP